MSDPPVIRPVRGVTRHRYENDDDDESDQPATYGYPTVRPAPAPPMMPQVVVRDDVTPRRLSAIEARLTVIEDHMRGISTTQQSILRLLETILVSSAPGSPIVITKKPTPDKKE
ncbi:ORF4 [Suffolk virus]|uniref:ORF4 n=1 Tax=Suffolk virus TaxID=1577137 RepID=A0A0A1G840_9VIRU|nr:ORF4 [Suffolk virus]AIY53913.1 ORF4 [Suffolk virus]